MSQRCFIPGFSYLIWKRLQKNSYFFKDSAQVSDLLLPLLGDAVARFGLICNDYLATPNGLFLILTMPSQQGDIPNAVGQLSNNLDRYLKIRRQLTGPIFEGGYDQPIVLDTEEKGLWAHTMLRTMAQAEGFSRDNEFLGDAILGIDQIGETAQRQLIRPSCIGANSKVGHNLRINFPLMPSLQHLTVDEVRERVARLTRKSRELIEVQKQEEGVPGYLEDNIGDLPEPATPRPRAEEVCHFNPRIEFDWRKAFDAEEEERLREQEVEEEERYKAWQEAYLKALEEWCAGNYEVPFPRGTYHMRVFHKCKINENNCDPPDSS